MLGVVDSNGQAVKLMEVERKMMVDLPKIHPKVMVQVNSQMYEKTGLQ